MSSTPTNILHQPTYTTLSIRSSNRKSSNPSLFVPFSTKKPVLRGGFVSRTMTEMVKTSAFRNSSSSSDVEEDVRALEQEAFIDGSSQVAAAGLESTINRLVRIFCLELVNIDFCNHCLNLLILLIEQFYHG